MYSLWQDVRFGFRMLLKNPVFTAVAILTLALGIGANTAIFSVVDAVLLRPLPYPNADRLVFLWSTMHSQGVPISGSALPNYHVWRDENTVFEGLAGFYNGSFSLASSDSAPELVEGAYITHNLFQVLQVSPIAGRLFLPEEEQYGKHHVVLLSYGLWQRRFAGQHDIVGQAIKVGGESAVVVGVMPKGMPFFDNLPEAEIWAPISFPPGDSMLTRNNHFVNLVGRLKPGITREQAQSNVSAIAKNMEQEIAANKGIGASIVPLHEQLAGDSRTGLLVLLGAVAFVLLVACVNVANLLLARATVRAKELAVRASLGAGRGRIIRQMMMEYLPLGLAGGLFGALLAVWGIDAISSLLPATLPRGNDISVNARVLMFTFALALLTVLIFGMLPALQSARADVREALSEGGRGGIGGRSGGRLRRFLVIAEVALALVLLVGSGLMIRSFINLRQLNTGFTAQNVLTMRVPLARGKYPVPVTVTDPDPKGLAFYEQLLARLKSAPGINQVSLGTMLPLGAGEGWGKFFSVEGRTANSIDEVPLVRFALISPGYFETFGIPLRRGRGIDESDRSDSQGVAVINETLARRFFSNEDPVGKTIWMGPPEQLLPAENQIPGVRFPRRTIVGVVADVKGRSLNLPTSAEVYAPINQYRVEGWSNNMMLAVQAKGSPESVGAIVREQVRQIDPDQPVTNIRTMDELLSSSLSEARFSLFLFGLFGGLALLLAAIGIYGVMATSVTQRTQEIGVRMALGAQKGDVLRLVLSQGMMLVVIGVAGGLAASVALTRLMSSLLFEVSATDPPTLIVITIVLSVVAMLACYLPALRATKVDPLVALRHE